MESKELISSNAAPRRRSCSRKTLILSGTLIAIVVIGLAIGLGVGLTRHSNDDNMGATSSTPSAAGPSTTTSASNLWQPAVNASWQIILVSPPKFDLNSNTVVPNVDVWDIDMFTNKDTTIYHLHKLNKKVVCYFSAGTYESGRPDSDQFQASDKGEELPDWPGEYWLNLNSQNVRNIMTNRIKKAASMKCDAIDPDNVDGYANKNGLGLTSQDSINYIKFLSSTAAQYGMSTGLKNAAGIIPQVLDVTAFSVNEQCAQYSECATFNPYIKAGKPVFHIEYPKDGDTTEGVTTDVLNSLCQDTGKAKGSYDFSTVIKNMNLNGWVQYCNGAEFTTPTAEGSSD